MSYYQVYGNVIVDSPGSLGGTLSITNSGNTAALNTQASIGFGVSNISYNTLQNGLLYGNTDAAGVRISAVVDTVSPAVGTALVMNVSGNSLLPPSEAMRISSNGNVVVKGNLNVGAINTSGDSIINAMVEKWSSGTVTTNAITVAYSALANIISITPSSAANIALTITSLPTTRGTAIYDFTFIISVATNKQYINSLNVNGSSVTMVAANGLANITVNASATVVLQTISIQMNGGTVTNAFTNVSSYF